MEVIGLPFGEKRTIVGFCC